MCGGWFLSDNTEGRTFLSYAVNPGAISGAVHPKYHQVFPPECFLSPEPEVTPELPLVQQKYKCFTCVSLLSFLQNGNDVRHPLKLAHKDPQSENNVLHRWKTVSSVTISDESNEKD